MYAPAQTTRAHHNRAYRDSGTTCGLHDDFTRFEDILYNIGVRS